MTSSPVTVSMPGLHPDWTCRVPLIEDAHLPTDQQRALICRFGTVSEMRLLKSRYLAALEQETDEDWISGLLDALKPFVVGFHDPSGAVHWKGIDTLCDVFSDAGLRDLCIAMGSELHVQELDKKKSARQSRLDAAVSARAAKETPA